MCLLVVKTQCNQCRKVLLLNCGPSFNSACSYFGSIYLQLFHLEKQQQKTCCNSILLFYFIFSLNEIVLR